ncbi:MAG: TIM barrel protein [Planctomycetes bacterium]|nr:TIM barrel protein [Planctomycetota bacterium]
MSVRLGVCSWSLRPQGPRELAENVRSCGLRWVQLALDPLRSGDWSLDKTARSLNKSGIGIASGMISMRGEDYTSLASIRETGGVRPDEHWEENARAAVDSAKLAKELGLKLVSFHAGFLPHSGQELVRRLMVERIRTIADAFAAQDVRVALETGQEEAETLLRVLQEIDRPNVGVNFDPANMILYGMGDPHEALEQLAPHVMQVHVKDALPSEKPDEWGTEVPVGKGAVDWARFFEVLNENVGPVDRMIEREAGDERVADILRAAKLVEKLGGNGS